MRKMKDSGVPFIGAIPNDWEVRRIKNLGFYRNGLTYSPEEVTDESGTLVLRSSNIKDGKLSLDDNVYVTTYIRPEIRLRENDILLCSRNGSRELIGKNALIPGNLAATYGAFMMVFRTTANPKYVYYLLNSPIFNFYLSSFFTSTINQLTRSNFGDMKVPFTADSTEQQRIADFLDAKTADVDNLRSQLERQIEILESYKRSVITETVTRGLDPSLTMRDTDDSWLPSIPTEWDFERAKYLFIERKSKGNSACLQLLSPTQQYGVIPQTKYDEISGMSAVKLKEDFDLNTLKTIHYGDFCISLRSFQGGFEYSEYEGVISPAYHVFYPIRKVSSDYYRYLFKEETFIGKINSYTISLRDGKNISFADFGRTFIPVPPLAEQQRIAAYLDEKVSAVDEIISLKQEQLTKLADYKKSLIFEYVTGKKEVLA